MVMGALSTIGRVLVMWLPAQLLSDSRLFAKEGGFLAFAIVGSSMMGIFMAAYGGFAGSIRSEQAMGTLESLLMSHVSIGTLVLGSNLWPVAYAILDAGLVLVSGSLLFGLDYQQNWLGAALVVSLTAISFAAVGILSAAFAVVYKRGDPFRFLVGGASFLLGGVIYPVEVLPRWLTWIAELLPITHGSRALRGLLIGGHRLSDYWRELLILTGFAGVGIPLAILVFARALRIAKRDGTLLQY
jgi:ABC-2 type transport system permease protein